MGCGGCKGVGRTKSDGLDVVRVQRTQFESEESVSGFVSLGQCSCVFVGLCHGWIRENG